MKRLLVLAVWASCTPAQRLTAVQPVFTERADGVRARVIELELPENVSPNALGTAVVEIENRRATPLAVDKERLEWTGLVRDPGPQGSGGLGNGLVSGARIGSSVGGSVSGGGGGSALGGGIGAGLGIIAIGIVVVPIGIGYLIYRAATAPPSTLEPGERARYRVDVTVPDVDVAQHITLGVALDDGGQVLNVPVVDPSRAHGGWGKPRRRDHIGVRIGGGPIAGDGQFSGTGGAQLVTGRGVGPIVVGAAVSLIGTSWSIGPELSVPLRFARDIVEVAPTVDFQAGLALVGSTWFCGPTGGVELTFPLQTMKLMGYDAIGMRMGLYGRGGPVWTENGRFHRWEVGMVFR